MEIKPKNFDYNTDAVSKTQYEEHLKLYKGYVNKVNEISCELATQPDEKKANAVYSKYRGLKKGQTFAIDGVILHEGYFQNMTNQQSEPQKNTCEVFDKEFGGFEKWKEDFKACAMSARGWVVLAYEQRTNSFCNFLQDKHDSGVICMAYPILILDMYEHAYFMDYGTNKEAYINKFMASIDWDIVERRLQNII